MGDRRRQQPDRPEHKNHGGEEEQVVRHDDLHILKKVAASLPESENCYNCERV
jgi:hypothetical protein